MYGFNPTTLPVLVVDDHADVRLALRILLRAAGIGCVEAASPSSAMEALSRTEFGCAVFDLNYSVDTVSGLEGLDLVARVREAYPDLALVVMTAWGSIDVAVKAMRLGASDFIEKPWNNERMVHTLRSQLALSSMRLENRRLRAEAALGRENVDMLRLCESSSMKRVVELMSKIASGDANVLILGENGTGKSLFAREIHRLSGRADGPLIRIDMGSLPESRFAAEMFGDEAAEPRMGRFELAEGGTLVMEEVGNIPFFHQVKLLRVIEEGELERLGSSCTRRVNTRAISTTNTDLDAAIRANRFRRDLLYRLNAMQVRLPALRERAEDIVPLARHILLRECRRLGRDAISLMASAERALRSYEWPGNIRELEHTIARAMLLGDGHQIDVSALALGAPGEAPLILDSMTLPEAEELLIRQALERSDHNLQRAADALGISRQALYRRIEKHRARSGLASADSAG